MKAELVEFLDIWFGLVLPAFTVVITSLAVTVIALVFTLKKIIGVCR